MKKRAWLFSLLFVFLTPIVFAQKKPLDHSVYDGWESIQERLVSADGNYVLYTINPQEGDGRLVLSSSNGNWKMEVPRGFNAQISADSRYAVFKIKPLFKETRDARIKKKKTDDMPKDSLGIIALGSNKLVKIERVKSYKMPVENGNWVAFQLEKPLPDTAKKDPAKPKNALADSLRRVVDSLNDLLKKIPEKVQHKYFDETSGEWIDADEPGSAAGANAEPGTELVWYELATGKTIRYKSVTEFAVSRKGNKLAMETSKEKNDSLSKARVIVLDALAGKTDTIMQGLSDVKNLAFDEPGNQLAFVAERDSSSKALQKFYKLWYWQPGADSAQLIADKSNKAVPAGWGISENATLNFSKSGARLFFGTAPIMPPKDTTVPEFEKAQLDIWHFNDENLQPFQLKNLDRELKRSYLAVYHTNSHQIVQLADSMLASVETNDTGDDRWFWAQDDKQSRVMRQWAGRGKADLYVIDPETSKRQMVTAAMDGVCFGTSPDGTTLLWYNYADRQYHTWKDGAEAVPTKAAGSIWYDEENDVPDDPSPYGLMAWSKDGKTLYLYDRFDIWKLDPWGKTQAQCLTAKAGRKANTVIRWQNLKREDAFVENGKDYLFTLFNQKSKKAGVMTAAIDKPWSETTMLPAGWPTRIGAFVKARNADLLTYSTEDFSHTPDFRLGSMAEVVANATSLASLYQPNPQQSEYNWGSAELIEWKAYDGKMTQGIVYKPEDFDPKKKYPMIAYFYETLSDGLYGYSAPSPTPSRLNIPFFVSRGYVVLAPDIHYRKGEPGQSAYDYIVSGARYLVKQGYVDSTRMGLQGQSWGGYQTVQLITMTNLFKAAWAGAPVANMTSAYGGIRWESGLNRQFQYEKTQSRIGATLWERPDLYLKNSPLFQLPKNKTPLVIMHNDADGAVPWYQGIELFTAMRRLHQPVWLLQYNNEAHNLVERRNRKDIQIREQQFFDWQLKGAAPAKWLTQGVPATLKGRDYGL